MPQNIFYRVKKIKVSANGIAQLRMLNSLDSNYRLDSQFFSPEFLSYLPKNLATNCVHLVALLSVNCNSLCFYNLQDHM